MERRDFLAHGLGAAAFAVGRGVAHHTPADTTSPRARALRREAGVRFGYAAITWDGDDHQAIVDISALGFRGIQLRASALATWGEKPGELRGLLAARGLTMVALSSGLVRLDPAAEAEDLATHVRNARFVRDAGGLYLQVVDQRPRGRAPTAEDHRRMGRLLTELGKRTADLGIPLGYHNHMGNLGQSPAEVAAVLDAADPRFVKLELDTAHYRQAGGDPAEAVSRYADRLLFLHVKDVRSPAPGGAPGSYQFVELGRGTIDFPAFFAALGRVSFDGWAVVELDHVPDENRTPRESGEIAKRYIEETLGLTL